MLQTTTLEGGYGRTELFLTWPLESVIWTWDGFVIPSEVTRRGEVAHTAGGSIDGPFNVTRHLQGTYADPKYIYIYIYMLCALYVLIYALHMILAHYQTQAKLL